MVLPANLDRERLAVVRTYCGHPDLAEHVEISYADYDPATGGVDLESLERNLGPGVAGVYFETPGSLGVIEPRCREIVEMAHAADALAIAGVDPISLGVLAPPGQYGADLAVRAVARLRDRRPASRPRTPYQPLHKVLIPARRSSGGSAASSSTPSACS